VEILKNQKIYVFPISIAKSFANSFVLLSGAIPPNLQFSRANSRYMHGHSSQPENGNNFPTSNAKAAVAGEVGMAWQLSECKHLHLQLSN
jgi:hypothetical protein